MIGSTVKLGFDGTAVTRGFAKVSAGFNTLGKGMAAVGRTMLAPFVKLMALLAPIMGVAGMGKGLKGVIDMGGELSDMAAKVGGTVKQMVMLKEIFRRTGIEGDKVGTVLQRMGRRTLIGVQKETGEYADALNVLGLRNKELLDLSLPQRFVKIGQAMNELGDESLQADVAMKLFGDDGFKLVNTFKDFANVMRISRQSVGELGSNMDQMADRFDKISDALGSIGLKSDQFFAGMASEILPSLEKMADLLNQLDLTSLGESFGSFIKTVQASFENGVFGELVWDSLKLAGSKFAAFIASALEYAILKMLSAFGKTDIGKKIKSDSERKKKLQAFGYGVLNAGGGGLYGRVGVPSEGAPSTWDNAFMSGTTPDFSELMSKNSAAFNVPSQTAAFSRYQRIAELEARQEWWRKTGMSNERIAEATEAILRKPDPQPGF